MEVQDKSQIKAALRQSFGSVVYTINQLSEQEFLEPLSEGKWSPGDILGHLILSAKPVNKAMSMPKLMLKTSFGKNNREENSFYETKDRYYTRLGQGVEAPANVVYLGVAEKGKNAMTETFTAELKKLLKNIDSWSEKDLSEYVLPHPALGKMTIREMLFFTHFHTEHHQKQMVPEVA